MKHKTGKRILAAIVLLLAVVCVFFGLKSLKRAEDHKKALAFEETGAVQSAYELFRTLGSYKDSAEHVNNLLETDPILPCRSAQKGDLVQFGRYEQDVDLSNGPEKIEWLVLERLEDQLLLLSMKGLEGKPYHTVPFESITWENCALRSWLNSDFLNTAFKEKEQSFIPVVLNQNKDQSAVGTDGGADTEDRVFLLSETEASIYLNSEINQDMIGKARSTRYCEDHNTETNEEGYVSWWLRSPGVYPYSAQFVDQNGKLYLSGAYVDIDYQFAVRPAIWLDLSR